MNTERKIEILKSLKNDQLFGLTSIRTDTKDGIILYERGARRVGGQPAIEVPHEDPYLVDESRMEDPVTGRMKNVPGVSPPPMTFQSLVEKYNCTTRTVDGFTYIVVDESVETKQS